jgi:hypothetical protein
VLKCNLATVVGIAVGREPWMRLGGSLCRVDGVADTFDCSTAATTALRVLAPTWLASCRA